MLTVWLAHRVLEPAEELERRIAHLEDAYDQARAEALLDALTGLGNHRAFQEEIERQWATAARYNRALALVLLDLDEFKQINDSSGHAAGDLLLRGWAPHIAGSLRRSDRAFRIGGDEFAILMPETDGDGAYVVTRRLLATSLEGEARRAGTNACRSRRGHRPRPRARRGTAMRSTARRTPPCTGASAMAGRS